MCGGLKLQSMFLCSGVEKEAAGDTMNRAENQNLDGCNFLWEVCVEQQGE